MTLNGKIVQVLPISTGSGKNGTWAHQDFILDQGGQYSKKVCLQLWGQEAIDKYDLDSAIGITVTAHINIESREWNGKYFTDVRCWKLEWDKQQKREWQPGGEGKKGAPAFDDSQEDTSLRGHYEGQGNLGSGPDTGDDLPF